MTERNKYSILISVIKEISISFRTYFQCGFVDSNSLGACHVMLQCVAQAAYKKN